MGKYMKKARGGGGVMEVMTQGSLGVKTRARAQAMQKESNSSNAKMNPSTSIESFIPTQISYLELRSRRLEKAVSCMSNKLPSSSSRKSTSAGECRRLSDLTNSDILADSSSRMALSIDEVGHTRSQARHQVFDENLDFVYNFHGDNEAEEGSLLQGFAQRIPQQWTSRGGTPPGVAHSRSNSRSNSVSRELPPPTRELPPRGILTRNQRKLEKQISESNACSRHIEVASCSAKSCGLAKAFDVEVSFGENPMEEVWSAGNRLNHEGILSSEANTLPFAAYTKLLPGPHSTIQREQPQPSTMHSSLDMEIEDFFFQAEQQVKARFVERYNFDPQKDVPLPGRYDWVEL